MNKTLRISDFRFRIVPFSVKVCFSPAGERAGVRGRFFNPQSAIRNPQSLPSHRVVRS